MSNLANQFVIAERTDLARGVRVLLAKPLLRAETDPADFDIVRRRKEPLTGWFDYYCGWTLLIRPGYARLVKVRTDPDSSRPARRSRTGRAPFDRRRYALFCVAAAELPAAPTITVGALAERIARATAQDPVVPAFDPAQRPERMAFVDVLRALESCGALTAIDGDGAGFAEDGRARALYRVDPVALVDLLAAPNGPAQVLETDPDSRIAALTAESRHDGSRVRRDVWLRHSVLRKVFDDPVVYWADLDEQQRSFATSEAGRKVLRQAAEQAGLVLEERAEGVLLADPEAVATEQRFPADTGIDEIAALHLLDELAAAPEGRTDEQLRRTAESVLAKVSGTARVYRSADGPARLAADAVAVLTGFGLARREAERVVALPAAARYAVGSGFSGHSGFADHGGGRAT